MRVNRPGTDVLTAYLEQEDVETGFDQEYLLRGTSELAGKEAMLPRAFTYGDSQEYQDHLSGASPGREFDNLGEFHDWIDEEDYLGKSLEIELFQEGDRESTIILAYENQGSGVLDWPSSMQRYESKIELNTIGDKHRDVLDVAEEYFPELYDEL